MIAKTCRIFLQPEQRTQFSAQQDPRCDECRCQEEHRPHAERRGNIGPVPQIGGKFVDRFRDWVECALLGKDQGVRDFQHGEAERKEGAYPT